MSGLPNVYRMLSVCTCHISKETGDWLNAECLVNATSDDTGKMASIHAGSHGYGWFIYCHDDGTDDYPKDLVEVINFAIEKKCHYINMDADGAKWDELKEYDW